MTVCGLSVSLTRVLLCQVLSLMEQEKSTLMEKLATVQQELADARLEYERLKRDSLGRQEQDHNVMVNLQGELKSFRSQFEEAM